jgi:hypothetical protein
LINTYKASQGNVRGEARDEASGHRVEGRRYEVRAKVKGIGSRTKITKQSAESREQRAESREQRAE